MAILNNGYSFNNIEELEKLLKSRFIPDMCSLFSKKYETTYVECLKFKRNRPLWATSLCKLKTHGTNDYHPYYWVGNGRYKRVTSKHVFWSICEENYLMSDFNIIEEYETVKFQRPFFEELNYANQLEF